MVTHERLFRGMEAPSVLYVAWSPGYGDGVRSGLMRAVASLVLVAPTDNVDEEKIEETFKIIKCGGPGQDVGW